jgi:hypothetical protein
MRASLPQHKISKNFSWNVGRFACKWWKDPSIAKGIFLARMCFEIQWKKPWNVLLLKKGRAFGPHSSRII